MSTCPNLYQLLGDRYWMTHDSAYDPKPVPPARRDPWMMQIPTEHDGVVIYPHGEGTLAVELNGHPRLAKKVACLPGVHVWQDGQGEKTFTFPVAMFEPVANVVEARRRRVQSAG
jgi:hypothetical protein